MHHPSQYGHAPNGSPAPVQRLGPRSYVNPHHSKQKKDIWNHYIIGDVYERFEGLRKGTFAKEKQSDGPYLRYLKALSRNGWSNLSYLADFVETSTVPIKGHLLSKEDFKERYSRTDVTILDYHESTGLAVQRVTSAAKLSEVLAASTWKDETGSMRLIISNDLSSTVIEALGSTYDVDPRVFRGYLTDYQWFHVRDPWYSLPPFKSTIGQIPFFSVIYPRLFYLPDEESVRRIESDTGKFNVLRTMLLDTTGSWTEPEVSRVGNLRSTTSFWSRPYQRGKGSLAIMLLDPDVPDSKPLWGNFQNHTNPPSIHGTIPERSGYESVIDDFITSAQTLIAEKGGGDIQPIDLVPIQMRSIATHWRTFMQHAETRLSIIEWVLQPPNPETARSLEDTLQQVHPWRRRIPLYRSILDRTIYICSLQAQRYPDSKAWADLLTDFLDLEAQRSLLEARVDRITSTMTAIIAIDENKKATGNANDVARITYLAFVFVPLSFLTGIFSMDRGFPEGGTMVYWVFVVLAVPMAGIPLLVALNWERIRGWWKGVKKGQLRDRREGEDGT